MIYRVVLKIGYYENWFDFKTGEDAIEFACSALKHHSPNEDRQELLTIEVQIMKKKEKEEE